MLPGSCIPKRRSYPARIELLLADKADEHLPQDSAALAFHSKGADEPFNGLLIHHFDIFTLVRFFFGLPAAYGFPDKRIASAVNKHSFSYPVDWHMLPFVRTRSRLCFLILIALRADRQPLFDVQVKLNFTF